MSKRRRFQVTAFLPSPLADEVQAVRERWDPVLAARIAPHVTVLHSVIDLDTVTSMLAEPFEPLLLGFGAASCWEGDPARGIYLPVSDVDGGLEALRSRLLGDAVPLIEYHAHVTLVHVRTAREGGADEAWAAVSDWRPLTDTIVIDDVALIGETRDGWERLG